MSAGADVVIVGTSFLSLVLSIFPCQYLFVSLNGHIRRPINPTQGEVLVLREEKKMLTGQARKLNNELRASLRRKEAASAQQSELKEAINELELECRAAEGDVR